jgi:hypothetical protein
LPEVGEQAELTSKQLKEVVRDITESLKEESDKNRAKLQARNARQLERDAAKLAEYEEQERILGDRNSYSKTDEDATAMRMKNTHELRPAYNVQVGRQDGFVTGCSVHQQANDGKNLKPHLEKREALGLPKIGTLTTDGVYGTEENYAYLEDERVEGYVKYPEFHRDLRDSHGPFHRSRFEYDELHDCYRCPNGRTLRFDREEERTTTEGFKISARLYVCESCENCKDKSECKRSEGPRTVRRNERLNTYRKEAYARLTTERGERLRRQRGHACETPFGDQKHNQGMRRFRLRGILKVTAEAFLVFLTQNVRRLNGLEQLPQDT